MFLLLVVKKNVSFTDNSEKKMFLLQMNLFLKPCILQTDVFQPKILSCRKSMPGNDDQFYTNLLVPF